MVVIDQTGFLNQVPVGRVGQAGQSVHGLFKFRFGFELLRSHGFQGMLHDTGGKQLHLVLGGTVVGVLGGNNFSLLGNPQFTVH